jgi:hypothetical protein
MLFVCDVLSRWSFSLVPEKLYSVGIPFDIPEPAKIDAFSPIISIRRRRFRLVKSHLRYFLSYLRIISRAPDSSFSSTATFLFHLLPIIFRWLKEDLSVH